MSFEFTWLALAFYRDTPKHFVEFEKVSYPRYKYDCATKLNGISPHVTILEDMEYPKERGLR